MKEMNYVPGGKESPWAGHVKLRIPRYRERIKMLKDAGYESGKEGVEAVQDQYAFADRMLEIVEQHVLSVDLEHGPTKKKFSSLEDLEMYQEGTDLINELGQAVLSGVKLGND